MPLSQDSPLRFTPEERLADYSGELCSGSSSIDELSCLISHSFKFFTSRTNTSDTLCHLPTKAACLLTVQVVLEGFGGDPLRRRSGSVHGCGRHSHCVDLSFLQTFKTTNPALITQNGKLNARTWCYISGSSYLHFQRKLLRVFAHS